MCVPKELANGELFLAASTLDGSVSYLHTVEVVRRPYSYAVAYSTATELAACTEAYLLEDWTEGRPPTHLEHITEDHPLFDRACAWLAQSTLQGKPVLVEDL